MSCVLAGIRFDNVTMAEAVAAIVGMARKKDKPALVCTANLDHFATMQRDSAFRAIYNSADFIVADGMPLVWLSRIAGTPLKERVAGSDLFWQLGQASSATGLSLFFLGGQPGCAENAAKQIEEKYPGARIVGTYCPPFGSLDTQEETEHIYATVRAAAPDILLVGLGSPKQEKWIATHKDAMNVAVSIGVGASFDMAAGSVQRAPLWAQKSGCEWLFRLAQEPRRLWSRYMGRDLPCLVRLVFATLLLRFQRRSTPPSSTNAAAL